MIARALVGLALIAGCATNGADSAIPPSPDRCAFERDVYPVLLRDCGFPACHGSAARAFRIHGPGRARLEVEQDPFAPATAEEIDAAYERVRSMLALSPTPEASLLLRKPLETAAGGTTHLGVDAYGRNVYLATDDPSYVAILSWARGAAEGCE